MLTKRIKILFHKVVAKSYHEMRRIAFIWNLYSHYESDRELEHKSRHRHESYIRQFVLGQLEGLRSEVTERIGERTTIHSDVHYRHRGSQVIVIGTYRNRDYVRVFDVETPHLHSLIEHLSKEEASSRVGRFDVPHAMPFRAVYSRETFDG